MSDYSKSYIVEKTTSNFVKTFLIGRHFLSEEYISNVKKVINQIVDAGNEFILDTPYLYWFTYNTLNSGNLFSGPEMNTLIKDLKCFTKSDRNTVLTKIAIIYDNINYMIDTQFYTRDMYNLRDNIINGSIPLSFDYHEQRVSLYDNEGLELEDYAAFNTILGIIVGYCLTNNTMDYYNDYCKLFTDNPTLVIDDLTLNKILGPDENGWLKVEDIETIIKYIIYKIENKDIKTREVK